MTALLLDVIRVVLTIVGFGLAGAYLRLRWPQTTDQHERARIIGMALALFILAGSRALNLGEPLTWQLLAAAIVFALVGYSMLPTLLRPQ